MLRKKTILLSTALAGLVVLGLGGVMVWLSEAGASPEQPIAFSHRQHVENDIHCAFCHPYYEKYDAAGIPRVELCVTCHAFMPQEDPESQKILEYADKGREIPWVRLEQLPQYSYFSHKWHIRAGLECSVCHGPIGESDLAARHVEYKMDWCVTCHEESGASVDCILCHT